MNVKTFDLTRVDGRKVRCALQLLEYDLGDLAVAILEYNEYRNGDGDDPRHWDVYAFLSLHVFPDWYCQSGEFVAKTYTENRGLLETMEALGLVQRTGQMSVPIGRAGPQPVCRLTPAASLFVVPFSTYTPSVEQRIDG